MVVSLHIWNGWCWQVEVIVADAPGWCLLHEVRLGDGVERLAECSLPVSSPSHLPKVCCSEAEGGQHTVCRIEDGLVFPRIIKCQTTARLTFTIQLLLFQFNSQRWVLNILQNKMKTFIYILRRCIFQNWSFRWSKDFHLLEMRHLDIFKIFI